MKKFLLSLMVLASLVSCGKDNKVSSSSGNGSSAITINDSSGNAANLGNYINQSETYFGNGYATNYGTWNQVVAANPYYSFKYVTTSYAGNANCSVKWSIFYVCTSSSSGSGSMTISRSVVASSVDVGAKRAELAAIVNSAVNYNGVASIQVSQGSNGSIYYVQTTSGVKYAIDTRLPIQANPTGIQQTNGQVEYFYGFSSN